MIELVKLLVSVALIVAAINHMDVHTMVRTLMQGSGARFIVAVIINLVIVIVLGVRWYKLIACRIPLPFLFHLGVYFKATFLNTFTPANIGGDVYRLGALSRETVTRGALLKLLLRERLLGFYGYVIVFAVAYAIALLTTGLGSGLTCPPYVYGMTLAACAGLLPVVARPLGSRILSLLRKIIGMERLPLLESWLDAMVSLLSPARILGMIVLTFFGILLWVISIKVIADGFGMSVSLLHLTVVATAVELVRLVPLTVQGVGLREGVFAYLLGILGYGYEQSYVVAAISYLALSLSIVLCGPIGLAMNRENRRIANPVSKL